MTQDEDGRLGSDEPTALAPPSGVKPQEGLEQSRSSTGAAFLNAAGELLKMLAGDRYASIGLNYTNAPDGEHFTAYLHDPDGAVRYAIGPSLAETFAAAEAKPPFYSKQEAA